MAFKRIYLFQELQQEYLLQYYLNTVTNTNTSIEYECNFTDI